MDNYANISNVDNEDIIRIMLPADAIRESSQKLSKIVKIIEDIASKSNPFSLNAEEAARAGNYNTDTKEKVI